MARQLVCWMVWGCRVPVVLQASPSVPLLDLELDAAAALDGPTLASIAVRLGATRLIDNVILK